MQDCRKEASNFGGFFDLDNKEEEVKRILNLSEQDGFWDDPATAQEIMQKISGLKEWITEWKITNTLIEDAEAMLVLAEEDKDETLEPEIADEIEKEIGRAHV